MISHILSQFFHYLVFTTHFILEQKKKFCYYDVKKAYFFPTKTKQTLLLKIFPVLCIVCSTPTVSNGLDHLFSNCASRRSWASFYFSKGVTVLRGIADMLFHEKKQNLIL